MPLSERILIAVCLAGLLVGEGSASLCSAGELRTKTGFLINGHPLQVEGLTAAAARASRGPTQIKSVYMVDDGMRRTFVPRRLVDDSGVSTENLQTTDEFTLTTAVPRQEVSPAVVGSYLETTPFDQYGHRRITLAAHPQNINVIQEIVQLRPETVTVFSKSPRWKHELSTNSLTNEVLLSLLQQTTDDQSPQDQLRIVRFLIDAQRYTLAGQRLALLRQSFPEMADQADRTAQQLHHLISIKALGEIQRRQHAGQHRFALEYAQKFPMEQVSAQVVRESREVIEHYHLLDQKIEKARMLLGILQTDLEAEVFEQVSPLRSLLCEELSYNTIDRLEPFLRAELDDTLTAEEKLGLAYSGWLLGDARADTSLKLAVRLWRARFLVSEYLRSESELDRRELLRELREVDGAMVETIAAMVPFLPMPRLTTNVVPGTPMTVELPSPEDQSALRYAAVVPPEYSPDRSYPLLVTLGNRGVPLKKSLSWWAGTPEQPGIAMHRGYIVMCPQYVDGDPGEYTYSSSSHHAVLAAIRDLRKRVHIDSDRIYLTGHGMGGDAAFDIGMSHPDMFAGVLPVVGLCDGHCKVNWRNCPDLAWYIVGGEKDRNTLEENGKILNRMMIRGNDITYVEYVGRGYEPYFNEQPRMFEWMSLHRRAAEPKEFNIRFLRPGDADLYWLNTDGFDENALQPVAWNGEEINTRPQFLEGMIKPSGAIYVTTSASRVTIKLSPSLVNFEQRVEVRLSKKRPYRDFVKPEMQTLLDDLRERGDRQRLYWAKLEF